MSGISRPHSEAAIPLPPTYLAVVQGVWWMLVTLALGLFAAGASATASRAGLWPGQAAPQAGLIPLTALGISGASLAAYLLALDVALVVCFAGLGLLIFWRKPRDGMALLVSLGLILLVVRITPEMTVLARTWPAWAAVVNAMVFVGVTSLPLIFSIFPNGKFTPRWTRWLSLSGVAYAAYVLMMPVSSSALPDPHAFRWISDIAFVGCGVGAQVYRYRRVATPQEKQQTKWAVWGFALGFAGYYGYYLPRAFLPFFSVAPAQLAVYDLVGRTILSLGLLMVPLTMAISILRHRLWDIDFLIRRTLIYGVLTAVLTLVYFSSVVLLQQGFRLITGQESDVAIVASTLAIAALANPLHRRVQAGIDRRFYRSKYDAARALEAFGSAVRHEVDLEKLNRNLLQVVAEAVEPAQASLWLNGAPPSARAEDSSEDRP